MSTTNNTHLEQRLNPRAALSLNLRVGRTTHRIGLAENGRILMAMVQVMATPPTTPIFNHPVHGNRTPGSQIPGQLHKGNTRNTDSSGKGDTRQPYGYTAQGDTRGADVHVPSHAQTSTSSSTFTAKVDTNIPVRDWTLNIFQKLITALAWCSVCNSITGLDSKCPACLNSSWFKCPKQDCFQQLGQNKQCDYCKSHRQRCEDYVQGKVTQHLPSVPFEALFDLVNGLSMLNWSPFHLSKSDFHVRAIEEIRLNRQSKFPPALLDECEYVLSRVDPSFINKMLPPYPPVYPTLPQLLAQGDPNRGYSIKDSNVVECSLFLELHRSLLQRKFEADSSTLSWPFSMMNPD